MKGDVKEGCVAVACSGGRSAAVAISGTFGGGGW